MIPQNISLAPGPTNDRVDIVSDILTNTLKTHRARTVYRRINLRGIIAIEKAVADLTSYDYTKFSIDYKKLTGFNPP